jgi:DNA repair exonuclease SbcCD ATPase subunit
VVPEVDTESINKLEVINSQIANIESTNKRIAQNNKYKEIRNSIKFDLIPDPKVDLVALNVACNEAFTKLQKVKSVISGATKLVKVCPSCGQTVDNSHKEKMVLEAKEMLPAVQKEYDASALELSNAQAKIKEYNYNVNSRLEWERYHSLIDNSVSSELLDIDELERTKSQLTSTIWQNSLEIKKATSANSEISANNARVEVIRSQILSMEEDKQTYAKLVNSISSRLSNLQILTKTFSPTGLVAYKIEVLVKDLEDLTNKYLQDMSDGRFQLGFKISSSDKLDVVITDNGVDIDIFALSNGELARVNVSTLLAIRKLMQSLSNSRINLLILDETVESLDTDGKERLIEVLLKEEHLNTVLVSHGFTHPLLEKLSIIKENNISRIE